MAKKPKWLEESTNPELFDALRKLLDGDVDTKKANKIVDELEERFPSANNVKDAISSALISINLIDKAYEDELALMDEEAVAEVEEAEEKPKKEKKSKKSKKSKKAKKVEEEPEGDEEDEEDNGYQELSQKKLKAMCKDRGIKVSKSMKKADFIKALEADDEE